MDERTGLSLYERRIAMQQKKTEPTKVKGETGYELGQRIIDRALIRCLSHQGIIRLLGIGRQGRMTQEDGQSHDGVR